jgi:hypothetical protein
MLGASGVTCRIVEIIAELSRGASGITYNNNNNNNYNNHNNNNREECRNTLAGHASVRVAYGLAYVMTNRDDLLPPNASKLRVSQRLYAQPPCTRGSSRTIAFSVATKRRLPRRPLHLGLPV